MTVKDIGETSDGYHTFNELYEHRNLLFIAWMVSDGCPGKAYWVKDHMEGWDLLCCEIWQSDQAKKVGQISYHIPKKLRHLYSYYIPERPASEHNFDGHTSSDVLERIGEWINN